MKHYIIASLVLLAFSFTAHAQKTAEDYKGAEEARRRIEDVPAARAKQTQKLIKDLGAVEINPEDIVELSFDDDLDIWGPQLIKEGTYEVKLKNATAKSNKHIKFGSKASFKITQISTGEKKQITLRPLDADSSIDYVNLSISGTTMGHEKRLGFGQARHLVNVINSSEDYRGIKINNYTQIAKNRLAAEKKPSGEVKKNETIKSQSNN